MNRKICCADTLAARARRTGAIFGLALLFAWPAASIAETAYVTDNLRLGMHAKADTGDRPFKVLDSGQPMEIISQTAQYALVRLPDDTRGYVKKAYLVDEKPAKLIVAETQAKLESVSAELAETKSAFAGSAGRIAELESQVGKLGKSLQDSGGSVEKLTGENEAFRSRLALYRFSLPWPMVLGAFVVALVLGFLAGMWWLDYRSRRRHGGFRIH